MAMRSPALPLNPGYKRGGANALGGKMAGGTLVKSPLDRGRWRIPRAACAVVWFGFAFSASALAQDAARLAAGEAAWDKAGCLQCHGSTGEGGVGGEFPAGPSLRKTRLDRAALIETISCGLPGTQMPGWLDGAYTQRPCYGFPPGPPPDAATVTPVLSADEVEALVDYLLAKIVGR
jgi:mono/diheme cytochrome c family protein